MEETKSASSTDDNLPYVARNYIDDVIKQPKEGSVKLFKWFLDNKINASHEFWRQNNK